MHFVRRGGRGMRARRSKRSFQALRPAPDDGAPDDLPQDQRAQAFRLRYPGKEGLQGDLGAASRENGVGGLRRGLLGRNEAPCC